MAALADVNSAVSTDLLARTRSGDGAAVNALFDRHKARLRRMVDLRLDRRLAGRVDPADVVRDACQGAASRLGEYLPDPDGPIFLWLRKRVAERLAELHKQHEWEPDPRTGAELSLYRDALPAASSAALAACLLGRRSETANPAHMVQRVLRIQDGLNALDPIDRELLALRHFEQLSREEATRVLAIDEGTASRRYVRALKRLNDLLAAAGAA